MASTPIAALAAEQHRPVIFKPKSALPTQAPPAVNPQHRPERQAYIARNRDLAAGQGCAV